MSNRNRGNGNQQAGSQQSGNQPTGNQPSKPEQSGNQQASNQPLQESKLAERQAAIDKIEFDPSEFERLRRENEQLRSDNESLRERSYDRTDSPSINPSAKVSLGNGYRFRVYSIKKGTKLKPKEIACCDESEAIRWYCQTTENPDKPGRQIKSEDEQLRVDCLDDHKRNARLIHDRRISMLRAKFETGHQLTESEMDELQKEEEKLVQPNA